MIMGFPTFTWPDWRKAPAGTKFRDTRNGRTGVLIGPSKNRHNGALVRWDADPNNPFINPDKTVNFVSIAVYAEPIRESI